MRHRILILVVALALAGCASADSGGGPAGPPGQAEFQAGVLYSKGKRLPGNYVKAARWYRAAAVLGHARAQGQLGFMYQTGQGVDRDYAQAVKWNRMAAEQGFAPAQFNLALLYGEGRGVPRDDVQAYMWLNVAAANTRPGTFRDLVAGERAAAAGRLSPERLKKARDMAEKWLAARPGPVPKIVNPGYALSSG